MSLAAHLRRASSGVGAVGAHSSNLPSSSKASVARSLNPGGALSGFIFSKHCFTVPSKMRTPMRAEWLCKKLSTRSMAKALEKALAASIWATSCPTEHPRQCESLSCLRKKALCHKKLAQPAAPSGLSRISAAFAGDSCTRRHVPQMKNQELSDEVLPVLYASPWTYGQLRGLPIVLEVSGSFVRQGPLSVSHGVSSWSPLDVCAPILLNQNSAARSQPK